jgi:hypothetical protein
MGGRAYNELIDERFCPIRVDIPGRILSPGIRWEEKWEILRKKN